MEKYQKLAEKYIPDKLRPKYFVLKNLADDPKSATQGKIMELGESYIPEEH